MGLGVEVLGLGGQQSGVSWKAQKVRKVLIVCRHWRSNILIPECSESIQLHRPAGKNGGRGDVQKPSEPLMNSLQLYQEVAKRWTVCRKR